MKIVLRSSDRFCGTVEQAWRILPYRLRELIMLVPPRVNQLHDLREVFTTFAPRCCELVIEDTAYDWDMPRSIDAAFIIAGDLYLEGKFYQSVQMIFFAAVLRELISDFDIFSSVHKLIGSEKLYAWVASRYFAHIHHAAVNTRTTKLLCDYLGNVYPSEKIWTRKLLVSVIPSTDDRWLVDHSQIILDSQLRLRKLVTLFCVLGHDNYREVQLCEDSTLLELCKVYLIHLLHNRKEFEFDTDSSPAEARRGLLTQPIKGAVIAKFGNFVDVNYDETEFHLFTCARRSLKELGIKEGDTFACRTEQFNNGVSDEGADETISQTSNEPSPPPRYAKKKINGKSKSKKKRNARKSSSSLAAYQKPTNQQIKEAHSQKMESVLNELRPQLQPIRRKLDSLTLQRQLPKEKKSVKAISHDDNDKENIGNFANLPGAKVGKTVYPILVGLESNLYSSSKVSRNMKIISLDLHGLSKKQALKTLQENLPRWVDIAMKREHPWVIPVNVICGGGSQELSEVVSTWIRRESQVANRPKSFT